MTDLKSGQNSFMQQSNQQSQINLMSPRQSERQELVENDLNLNNFQKQLEKTTINNIQSNENSQQQQNYEKQQPQSVQNFQKKSVLQYQSRRQATSMLGGNLQVQEFINTQKKKKKNVIEKDGQQSEAIQKRDNAVNIAVKQALKLQIKEKIKRNFFFHLSQTQQRRYKNLTKRHLLMLNDKVALNFYNEKSENKTTCADNIYKVFHIVEVITILIFNKLKIQPFYPNSQYSIIGRYLECFIIIYLTFFYSFFIFFSFDSVYVVLPSVIIGILAFLFGQAVRMNTSYYDQGHLISDRKLILNQYRKLYFLSDFLGLFALLYHLFDHRRYDSLFQKFMVSLIFTKWKSLIIILNQIEENLNLTGNQIYVKNLFKLLSKAIILCHFVGILYHLLAEIEIQFLDEQNTWIQQSELTEEVWIRRYVESFYWAQATIMLVGSKGVTLLESIFCIITLFATVGMFATILSSIANILDDMDMKTISYRQDLEILYNFFNKNKHIDIDLQGKLMNYLKYLHMGHAEMNESKDLALVLNKFPPDIQDIVRKKRYSKELDKFVILKKYFSEEIIQQLIDKKHQINEEYYMPNQIIYYEKRYTEPKMYLVLKGQVDLLHVDEFLKQEVVYEQVKAGKFFGTNSFFTDQQQYFTAKSSSFTTVLTIERKIFMQLIKQSQKDFEKFCSYRDDIAFNGMNEEILDNCLICKTKHHTENKCQFLNYNPSRLQLLLKYAYCVPNERRIFQARKVKKIYRKQRQERGTLYVQKSIALKSQRTLNFIDDQQNSQNQINNQLQSVKNIQQNYSKLDQNPSTIQQELNASDKNYQINNSQIQVELYKEKENDNNETKINNDIQNNNLDNNNQGNQSNKNILNQQQKDDNLSNIQQDNKNNQNVKQVSFNDFQKSEESEQHEDNQYFEHSALVMLNVLKLRRTKLLETTDATLRQKLKVIQEQLKQAEENLMFGANQFDVEDDEEENDDEEYEDDYDKDSDGDDNEYDECISIDQNSNSEHKFAHNVESLSSVSDTSSLSQDNIVNYPEQIKQNLQQTEVKTMKMTKKLKQLQNKVKLMNAFMSKQEKTEDLTKIKQLKTEIEQNKEKIQKLNTIQNTDKTNNNTIQEETFVGKQTSTQNSFIEETQENEPQIKSIQESQRGMDGRHQYFQQQLQQLNLKDKVENMEKLDVNNNDFKENNGDDKQFMQELSLNKNNQNNMMLSSGRKKSKKQSSAKLKAKGNKSPMVQVQNVKNNNSNLNQSLTIQNNSSNVVKTKHIQFIQQSEQEISSFDKNFNKQGTGNTNGSKYGARTSIVRKTNIRKLSNQYSQQQLPNQQIQIPQNNNLLDPNRLSLQQIQQQQSIQQQQQFNFQNFNEQEDNFGVPPNIIHHHEVVFNINQGFVLKPKAHLNLDSKENQSKTQNDKLFWTFDTQNNFLIYHPQNNFNTIVIKYKKLQKKMEKKKKKLERKKTKQINQLGIANISKQLLQQQQTQQKQQQQDFKRKSIFNAQQFI